VTEQYPPYESEETYEWDYDDRPKGGGRVLWGRVLALAVGLFLTFLLGRMTAPDDGVPASALRERDQRIEELEEENAELEAFLEDPQPADTETPAPTDTATETPVEEGQTYVVKRGDTLRGIAQTFCGDASFDDVIAEYNDIPDPTAISVGAELLIPPDCGE
jgi:LysM repeat protein